MTTSNEDSDKINAYNLNVAGYILKPLSFEKFILCGYTKRFFM
jgi:DNA-binding NarL/FixJ family response regulator